VMPPVLPQSLNEFVDLVIPELQSRGLFRTAYEGKTLREHYGLAWPESWFKDGMTYERPKSAVAMGGV